MAAYFGHSEHISLTLGALLKGGLPAPPSAEGRRAILVVRCLLLPGVRAVPLTVGPEDRVATPPLEGKVSPAVPVKGKGKAKK